MGCNIRVCVCVGTALINEETSSSRSHLTNAREGMGLGIGPAHAARQKVEQEDIFLTPSGASVLSAGQL